MLSDRNEHQDPRPTTTPLSSSFILSRRVGLYFHPTTPTHLHTAEKVLPKELLADYKYSDMFPS